MIWVFLVLSLVLVIVTLGLVAAHRWVRQHRDEVVRRLAALAVGLAASMLSAPGGGISYALATTSAVPTPDQEEWAAALLLAKRFLISVVAMICLVVLIIVGFAARSSPSDWTVGALYFLLMFAGMAGKTVWDAMENRKTNRPPRIDFWNLVKPAVVSPIIFAGVWKTVGHEYFDLITACFAFQNGFMWQTLLGKAIGADLGKGGSEHQRQPTLPAQGHEEPAPPVEEKTEPTPTENE